MDLLLVFVGVVAAIGCGTVVPIMTVRMFVSKVLPVRVLLESPQMEKVKGFVISESVLIWKCIISYIEDINRLKEQAL